MISFEDKKSVLTSDTCLIFTAKFSALSSFHSILHFFINYLYFILVPFIFFPKQKHAKDEIGGLVRDYYIFS